MTRKIIVDTDPGQDDAVAILVALASPELEVLGITTVAGNVPLELTARNARMMCELASRTDVPVMAGCDRPMVRALITAEYVHGSTGIDGTDLPQPSIPLADVDAVDFIIETVMREEPQTVTICPLGPLTNIGTALDRRPDIAQRLHQIVLMGGGFFEGGNTTPAAEFNIYVDPEAAAIVFGSDVPLVVMPLDVTHKALTNTERIEAFRRLGSAAGKAVAGMLDFYQRYDRERYGTIGAPLHDPCVIAYLLEPDLFDGRMVNVEIETDSPLTTGMTVVDYWGMTNRDKNALYMTSVDADGYFALLTERIGRL